MAAPSMVSSCLKKYENIFKTPFFHSEKPRFSPKIETKDNFTQHRKVLKAFHLENSAPAPDLATSAPFSTLRDNTDTTAYNFNDLQYKMQLLQKRKRHKN